MAKIIDITDKLTFEENPQLVVKGKKIEVNTDAPTLLKIISLMDGSTNEMNGVIQSANLLFSEKGAKTIEGLKLPFKDYITLIKAAITLATGIEMEDEEEEGE